MRGSECGRWRGGTCRRWHVVTPSSGRARLREQEQRARARGAELGARLLLRARGRRAVQPARRAREEEQGEKVGWHHSPHGAQRALLDHRTPSTARARAAGAGGRGPRRVDSPAGPGDLGRAMRPHPPPPHRTPGRGQRSNPGLPDADGQGCPVCHLPHAWLGRVATRSLLPSSRGGSPHLPGACPLLPSIRFGDAQLSPGGPCLQPRWLSHSGSETAAAGRR